jgi:TPR repeat protein
MEKDMKKMRVICLALAMYSAASVSSDSEAVSGYIPSEKCQALEGDAMQYLVGTGRPQNYSKATKLFERASFQKCAKAQYHLGEIYFLGLGTLTSYENAYIWFSISASFGYEAAMEKRDEVARKITTKYIIRGQKRSTEIYDIIVRLGRLRANKH